MKEKAMLPHLEDWRVVFETPYWRLTSHKGWCAAFPTGSPPAACLVSDSLGRVVLLDVFRPPLGRPSWEIPRGRGDVGETVLQVGLREAAEETGLDMPGAEVVQWPSFSGDGGILGFVLGMVWVRYPGPFPEVLPIQASEIDGYMVVDKPRLREMLMGGEIVDAATMIACWRFLAQEGV